METTLPEKCTPYRIKIFAIGNGRHLFFCVAIGLWAGLAIGFTTEYFTSNAYR
jgi:inorganic pyrophosphatase